MSTTVGNAAMQPHAKVYKPHAVLDDAIDPRWLAVRDHLQKSIQDQHDEMEQTRYDLQALKIMHKNLTCDFEDKVAELESAHQSNALLQLELRSCGAELQSNALLQLELRSCGAELQFKNGSIASCMKELKQCLDSEKKAQQNLLNSQLQCQQLKQDLDTERLKNEELQRAVATSIQECDDLKSSNEDLQEQLKTVALVKANKAESDDIDDDEDLMLVLEENADEDDDKTNTSEDSDNLEYVIDTVTEPSNGHTNGSYPSVSEISTSQSQNHLLLGDNLGLKSLLRAREKELKILKQALVRYQILQNSDPLQCATADACLETDPVVAYAKLEQALKDNESMTKLLELYKRLLEDKANAWLSDKSVLQALWKVHFLKQYPKKGRVNPKAFEERIATFNEGKAWAKSGADNTKHTPAAKPKTKSLFLATIKAASSGRHATDANKATSGESGLVQDLSTDAIAQEPGTLKRESSYAARTILWSDSDDDLELVGTGGGNSNLDVLATTPWSELRDANWPNGEATLLDL